MPSALKGGDYVFRVHRERRGNHHGVNVFGRKQLLIIAIDWRLLAGDFARCRKARLVDVAQASEADTGDAHHSPHQLLATATRTDDAEMNLVAG